jgi:hypothetical protein
MKYQIGSSNAHVEVGQYREVNKGALKAYFTFIEYPTGRQTLDCKYFIKGDQRWFSLPQKEVKQPNAEKPTYYPIIKYLDSNYHDLLRDAILTALKEEETNAQKNVHQNASAPLQDDTSSLWFR